MSVDVLDRVALALTDRHAIERVLGRGGMATVYLARDRKHDRPVAVAGRARAHRRARFDPR